MLYDVIDSFNWIPDVNIVILNLEQKQKHRTTLTKEEYLLWKKNNKN